MAGFIYVMSSPVLSKLSKIGKSLTVPCKHGLTEQNTTDARSAFECAYYINVENYDWFLSTVYAELKLFGKAQNRDVFEVDCSEIIKFIQEKAHENKIFNYEKFVNFQLETHLIAIIKNDTQGGCSDHLVFKSTRNRKFRNNYDRIFNNLELKKAFRELSDFASETPPETTYLRKVDWKKETPNFAEFKTATNSQFACQNCDVEFRLDGKLRETICPKCKAKLRSLIQVKLP